MVTNIHHQPPGPLPHRSLTLTFTSLSSSALDELLSLSLLNHSVVNSTVDIFHPLHLIPSKFLIPRGETEGRKIYDIPPSLQRFKCHNEVTTPPNRLTRHLQRLATLAPPPPNLTSCDTWTSHPRLWPSPKSQQTADLADLARRTENAGHPPHLSPASPASPLSRI